ncbi:MAG: J domain-containing protein [Butyrivibrio sp.]|nr:J domain-containing protein [Butyrivibrio sp.]
MWEWLEIEPTTDVSVIKKAYAEAAKRYHPAVYPEEFKKLRECFKSAISYAKNHHDTGYNEKKQEETFSYDISKQVSEREEREETFSYDISKQASEREETEETFSYDISKQESERENTEKPEYDFSDVSCDDSLSDRQSRMLKLFKRIIVQIHEDPEYYRHDGLIEAIMWNWDISPYKEEVTPVFIDCLVDILSDYPGLSNDVVTVIESRLFKDISDPRIGVLYSKFKTLYPNGHNSYDRNLVFKVDVEKWFCGHKGFPKVSSNKYIAYRNFIKKGKDTFFVLADDVLMFGKKYSLKYFFWEELSYEVDPVSDKLTIYAPDNTLLIEVKTGELKYMHFLDRLVTNKSRYIGKKVMDKSGFISNLDKYSRTFGGIKEELKIKLIWVYFFLGGAFITWLGFMDDTNFFDRHPFIALMWAIIVLMFVVSSLIFFILLICELYQSSKTTSIIGINIKHIREFRKDIKDGKAEYVLGNQIFLFKKYMIYSITITGDYRIIPLDVIRETECIKKIPGKQTAKLKMVLKNGLVNYCEMNSETAIRAVMTNILMRQLEDRKWS